MSRASHTEAWGELCEGVNVLKMSLGIAGDFPASSILPSRSRQRLEGLIEGTDVGARDAWPRAWRFEKCGATGTQLQAVICARALDILDVGGSDGAIDAVHGNDRFSGTRNEDFIETPWFVGAGVKLGSAENQIEVAE